MRLVFLGPPGAGKGTHAAKGPNHLGVPRISTGDILRRHVADGTELGRKAKGHMEAGGLVPDDLVIEMTRLRLRQPAAKGGFILDGFPRTIAQAEALAKLTPLDAVVNLFLEPEELIKRSTGRRVCPSCEAVYHIAPHPRRRRGPSATAPSPPSRRGPTTGSRSSGSASRRLPSSAGSRRCGTRP